MKPHNERLRTPKELHDQAILNAAYNMELTVVHPDRAARRRVVRDAGLFSDRKTRAAIRRLQGVGGRA